MQVCCEGEVMVEWGSEEVVNGNQRGGSQNACGYVDNSTVPISDFMPCWLLPSILRFHHHPLPVRP